MASPSPQPSPPQSRGRGGQTQRLRRSPAFGVEIDAMPGGFVCSASMKRAMVPGGAVKESIHGDRPLRKLFSKEQRAFYAEHAPEGLGFVDLAVLGPIFVLKLKWAPAGLPRKLVAEFWLYPDDSRILELSSKCPPADAFTAAAEMRAFLAGHGVDLAGEQATKTRRALEFFAGRAAVAACTAATRLPAAVDSTRAQRAITSTTPTKATRIHIATMRIEPRRAKFPRRSLSPRSLSRYSGGGLGWGVAFLIFDF